MSEEANKLISNLQWEIPTSWRWVQIGEICQIVGGGTPSTKDIRNFTEGDIPWITPADLSFHIGKFIYRGSRNITRKGLETSSARILPAGTVLFSSRAPIGYVAIAGTSVTTNQGFKSFIPPASLLPDYLYYYLQRAKPIAINLSSGTTFQEISASKSAQIPLPIAPEDEQKRIVTKIEELFSRLDAGAAALERARTNLGRYRAAIIKAAVEGELTREWREDNPPEEPASKLLERILYERRRKWEEDQIASYPKKGQSPPKDWKDKYKEPVGPDATALPPLPEGWCWATVDQCINFLRNGVSKKPSGTPPGHKILRINAVRSMHVNYSEVKYYNEKMEKIVDYILEDGDLLFTRYNGSLDFLGVSGMIRNCKELFLHPDKLIRVKTVFKYPLAPYIELVSNVGISRKHMLMRARTTAGQTGISGTDIREMPIPLCPTIEQTRILHEVENILSGINETENLIWKTNHRIELLRQSILKQAFKGKLVPQDPSDEPTSVLLAKIKAGREKTGVSKPYKKSPRKKAVNNDF